MPEVDPFSMMSMRYEPVVNRKKLYRRSATKNHRNASPIEQTKATRT
jgi:hypothetical protein